MVAFSGGKDSTVLLHLVRSIFPDVKAVFSNTGLEYPEIQKHVMSIDNVDIIRPTMRFDEVISTYGYPLIGKEVAEAIYYARRIRSQNGKVERERERAESDRRSSCHQTEKYFHPDERCKEQTNRTNGQIEQGNRNTSRGNETNRRRGDLHGAGVGGKSQFNKEKWLPLVYTPFMISHYCCHKMKKSPMKKYEHKHHLYPIIGTLAEESRIRKQGWIRHGCNAFDVTNPTSQPLSFWTEQDILAYIVKYNLPIASVYGNIVNMVNGNEYPPVDTMGNIGCNLKCTECNRTGCVFCGFGFHMEKGETRFQRLAKTHPRQYEYSIGGGQWVDNPYYDPVAPEYDGEWKNWNPKKIWVPSKKGLGMGKVFDMANEIYGKDFYRYE